MVTTLHTSGETHEPTGDNSSNTISKNPPTMRAGIEMKCSTQGGGVSGVGSEVVVDPLSGEGRGTMSVIQNMVIDTDIDIIFTLY